MYDVKAGGVTTMSSLIMWIHGEQFMQPPHSAAVCGLGGSRLLVHHIQQPHLAISTVPLTKENAF